MDYIDIHDYGKKNHHIRNCRTISHIGAEIKFKKKN